jgi:hypothetical protein
VIQIECDGEYAWLEASPFLKDQVRQIPGARHDSRRQLWRLPLSWATCVISRGVFGNKLQVGHELVSWATEERARIGRVMAARDRAMDFG